MTQKQVKIGKSKKCRKVKQVEDEYESRGTRRRALLLSSDDVERMAVESSRARLINHLVSKSEDHSHREPAAYCRRSNKYQVPSSSVTHSSHANRVPIPKAPYVIPAYQSLVQPPRWCPQSMKTSPQGSYTERMEIPPYICKCANCTSMNCPGRKGNGSNSRKFKGNITTFCDQCTMTPNVHDVACGRTPLLSSPIYSDTVAPCCSSMFGLIDDHCKNTHGRSGPSPILKRGCMNCAKKKTFCDFDPCKTKSVKCFFKKERDESSDCEEIISRRNIYNEGISDMVTGRSAPCPRTVPCSPRCSSRTSVTSSSRNSNIPHSHRNESRYHKHCVDPPDGVYVQDNFTETTRGPYTFAIPKLVARRTCGAKPCRRHSPVMHNIKMPKKVLMSERVLDHGTERIPCNKMPCRRK
ncbi:uncharacterized protein LOC118265328 [Spodoptera frugiperda]|uniref:Uncharacterized protein LOC118265328 n=1 Tax=Spodoptera frugiperda TaxID=7108 RepID=A0A9R0CYP7_SPOFR|nr:uncharacterized protein LOC118265328 [Spodoptera frugiperda]